MTGFQAAFQPGNITDEHKNDDKHKRKQYFLAEPLEVNPQTGILLSCLLIISYSFTITLKLRITSGIILSIRLLNRQRLFLFTFKYLLELFASYRHSKVAFVDGIGSLVPVYAELL